MKNRRVCLGLLSIIFTTLNAQYRYIRVVPIAQDAGVWKVLLGLNTTNRRNRFWNDFFASGNTNVGEILQNQTNGQYSNSKNNISSIVAQYTTPVNDQVNFVEVTFVPGSTLYKFGRNNTINDFVWVPANYIITSKGDITPPIKKENISSGVLGMLRNYLPDALTKIQTLPTTTPTTVAQPSAGAINDTWGVPGTSTAIPGAIYFYESNKPYYEFTNFWGKPNDRNFKLLIDFKEWPTTEHYFQAQKFVGDPQMQEKIRKLATPRDVFDKTRGIQPPLNWHQKDKFVAMLKAVREKFKQNENLKQMLLKTGDAIIVEAADKDYEWGYGCIIQNSCPNIVQLGHGKNHLGQILMQVRAELRGTQEKPYDPQYDTAQKYFAAHPPQPNQLQNALSRLEQALQALRTAL